jgi:hypothetical protein
LKNATASTTGSDPLKNATASAPFSRDLTLLVLGPRERGWIAAGETDSLAWACHGFHAEGQRVRRCRPRSPVRGARRARAEGSRRQTQNTLLGSWMERSAARVRGPRPGKAELWVRSVPSAYPRPLGALPTPSVYSPFTRCAPCEPHGVDAAPMSHCRVQSPRLAPLARDDVEISGRCARRSRRRSSRS